jgi:hypothetical protein
LVEEQGDLNGQLQDGVSFRSQVEGQDLVGVGQGQSGEGDTVRAVVQEDEGDDGVTSSDSPLFGKDGGTGGDTDVTDQHADSRGQPERPPSELFTEERGTDGPEPVPMSSRGCRGCQYTLKFHRLSAGLTKLEDLH